MKLLGFEKVPAMNPLFLTKYACDCYAVFAQSGGRDCFCSLLAQVMPFFPAQGNATMAVLQARPSLAMRAHKTAKWTAVSLTPWPAMRHCKHEQAPASAHPHHWKSRHCVPASTCSRSRRASEPGSSLAGSSSCQASQPVPPSAPQVSRRRGCTMRRLHSMQGWGVRGHQEQLAGSGVQAWHNNLQASQQQRTCHAHALPATAGFI